MKKFYLELILSIIPIYFLAITPIQAMTTTAGSAPTSTAGMYQTQTQSNTKTGQVQQSGSATNTAPVSTSSCVNSGILGERCGVKAVQFCKQNLDNPDCQKILKESETTK